MVVLIPDQIVLPISGGSDEGNPTRDLRNSQEILVSPFKTTILTPSIRQIADNDIEVWALTP